MKGGRGSQSRGSAELNQPRASSALSTICELDVLFMPQWGIGDCRYQLGGFLGEKPIGNGTSILTGLDR